MSDKRVVRGERCGVVERGGSGRACFEERMLLSLLLQQLLLLMFFGARWSGCRRIACSFAAGY